MSVILITGCSSVSWLFSLLLVQHQITTEASHRKALGFKPLPLENGGVASTG